MRQERVACAHRRRPSSQQFATKDPSSYVPMAHIKRSKPGNTNNKQPIYAWGSAPNNHCDPSPQEGKINDNNVAGANTDMLLEAKTSHNHQQQHLQPSFYDREALQEKLRGLQAEELGLSEREDELRGRLEKAQATLSAMRVRKRQLSTVKLLDQVKAAGSSCCSDNKPRDGRAQRQEEKNVRILLE